MSDELRKSLESIQSLLSQTANNNNNNSPMTGSRLYASQPPSHTTFETNSSNPNNHSSNYHNSNNYNDNSNDYMNLHSPSLSTVNNTTLSPQTPATQVTLPSNLPGGSRYVGGQQQQQEEERFIGSSQQGDRFGGGADGRASLGSSSHHHHHSSRSSNQGITTSNLNSEERGGPSSERSSSICNFSNSTPYQISSAAASTAFSSGGGVGSGMMKHHGGGAVIGSPLSAFSAVSGGGKKQSLSSFTHMPPAMSLAGGSSGGLDRSSLHGGSSRSGKQQQQQRETMSLLVSPPTARLVEEDDTTATTTTATADGATTTTSATNTVGGGINSMDALKTPKENTEHHSHRRRSTNEDDSEGAGYYGPPVNPNPNAKDPTPYHYRGNPPAKDYSVRSSQQQYHQQQQQSQYHHQGGRSQQQYQRDDYHHQHSSSNNSTSTSTSSSLRSIDPPAKSPFGSAIPATGGSGHYRSQQHYHHNQQQSQQQQQQHNYYHTSQTSTPNPHHHTHPITELSIIEEDENHHHHHFGGGGGDHLNQSHTSTVTGFTTLPRTPVLREVNGTSSLNLSGSGGGGRASKAAGRISGSVAFATNTLLSTPGTKYSQLGAPSPSTEKLLRRPSAAMRDSFQQLASQTAHQLEDIWDIVGIVPEERASQLADLVDRIAALCQEKIGQEEQLADQFRKEICAAREEWEESCRVLRIDNDEEEEEDPLVKLKRDPSVGESAANVGISLQSEYEVMMGRLESIRERVEVATEDIVKSQSRIYEAYAALNGCSVEEARDCGEMEAWADTKTNLTEEQRELFRSKAVEYEESVSSRTQAVVSLVVDCQNLIRELEIVPPGCEGEEESEGYIEVGRYEDDVKIMNSLKSIERSNDNDGRPRSRGKSTDSYTVTSLFESPSCIGIGKDALDNLTSRIAELNGEKRRRRNKLGEMGAAIASLWSMLRVPPAEQHAFTKSIRGLGMDTLDKGERELSRLHELKTVMIGKLIREQRLTIEKLWEKTNSSEKEKASFDRYFYINDEDKLTDVLLAKHEEYAGALNAKLEKMQPILELIERRESIIEERVELEMLQKDPDRLKGRNASKQLMKEEKMMRRVQKELPKITQHLEKKLKEWYVMNKPSQTDDDEVRDEDLGHFMYKGHPYLKTMKSQENEWVTRKERGEKERQRKRQEERSTSSGSRFGSNYSKLPGKKWNPPAGDRPRSASNMRPGSRGLRPADVNRVNRPGDKSTKPGMTAKSSGYGARSVSAPRARF